MNQVTKVSSKEEAASRVKALAEVCIMFLNELNIYNSRSGAE